MRNELEIREDSPIAGLADTEIVQIAKQAELRIDAMKKIKNTAIKLTNEGDWVDQGGKPYLQASGSEKIASAFGISWSFLSAEPSYEEDDEGHYTYTYHGRFTMAGRSIEIDGSRSSRDPFFKQYDYPDNKKTERDIHDRSNKRDVKMAALTNLLGNGITRMIGIRNMTYADLSEFAGIEKKNLGTVSYEKKSPVQKPQSKSKAKTETTERAKIITTIGKITPKDGKRPYKILGEGDVIYSTYSDSFAALANSAMESGMKVEITHRGDAYNTLETIDLVDENA